MFSAAGGSGLRRGGGAGKGKRRRVADSDDDDDDDDQRDTDYRPAGAAEEEDDDEATDVDEEEEDEDGAPAAPKLPSQRPAPASAQRPAKQAAPKPRGGRGRGRGRGASGMVVTPHAAPAAAAAAAAAAPPAGKRAKDTTAAAGAAAAKLPNLNENLTKPLMEVAAQEKAAGEMGKFFVYVKAVNALKAHPTKITSGAEAKKLSGIGDKLAAKIQEILDTGTLQRLQRGGAPAAQAAAAAVATAQTHLGAVWLLPASTMAQLAQEGITTVEDLKQHAAAKLTPGQQVALAHLDELAQRVPRAEVEDLGAQVRTAAHAEDAAARVALCGEHRRGAADSGTVVVGLASASIAPEALLAGVAQRLRATQTLGADVAVLSEPRRLCVVAHTRPGGPARPLDLRATRAVPWASWPCAVLAATLDGPALEQLQQRATAERFVLTTDALRPLGSTGLAGTPVPLETDATVYAYLRMDPPATLAVA